ncbi:GTP-binding protein Rheb homolog [Tribolium madens]|uniref:GTP-binding protein Rheb homolog n=1 Tax=Tribolium madens TaxID=41895 RepID=UPI001CF7390E|nr:GTP-binding protein Rheb homolog [Tribolium madens]
MPAPKQRKIALMGYRSVGKSSLSMQFVEGKFLESYDPTIENTFKKSLRINSTDYELILVDTTGQDEFSMFPSQYSLDVHGYVLVYSIENMKSFEVVSALYNKLVDITGKTYFPSVLVGNKSDMFQCREVSAEEGRKLAEKWKATFLETSAKHNIAVAQVFQTLLNDIERADGNEKPSCSIN